MFPAGDIVVVSPHLDDAAFSVGACMAELRAAARIVKVVTLFAGDPGSDAGPSPWDERCGFGSAAESARTRRAEDRRACELLGVEPVWLPFDVRWPDGVAEALLEAVQGAAVVLVPGFPCSHRDHILAARTVLQGRPPGVTVGLYVDQPYAMWQVLGREATGRSRAHNVVEFMLGRSAREATRRHEVSPHLSDLAGAPEWLVVRRSRWSWVAKQRATLAYASQQRAFSRAMPAGIALYEWHRGGERIAWL